MTALKPNEPLTAVRVPVPRGGDGRSLTGNRAGVGDCAYGDAVAAPSPWGETGGGVGHGGGAARDCECGRGCVGAPGGEAHGESDSSGSLAAGAAGEGNGKVTGAVEMGPVSSYQLLIDNPRRAPSHWKTACTHTESTLHQLSPYIGKLKSSIAHDLIAEYTRKGDLVADIFCGSGTVPLECVGMGRRAFAADASFYAMTLTKGKLLAPHSLAVANADLERSLVAAGSCEVDTLRIPKWVRAFYHPETLDEMMRLLTVLRKRRHHFLMACLLGIAHHQRPGFLSYPASNLVPYLRSIKFPREDHPEMYEYRSVGPRIKAKVARALRRYQPFEPALIAGLRRSTVEYLTPPKSVQCFITSPPYMNALDYGRDNRLRNWLLAGNVDDGIDKRLGGVTAFRRTMTACVRKVSLALDKGGHCIFVVGERIKRTSERFPSEILSEVVDRSAPCLRLKEIISDRIPDVRRARRHLDGVKVEHILVYERATSQ